VTDPARSSAAFARRAQGALQRRVGRPAGQGIPRRCSIRSSPRLRDRLYDRRTTRRFPPAALCAEWAAKLGLPAAFPSPSARWTSITARSAAASRKACWSRPSAPRPAIARSSMRRKRKSPTSPASAASSRGDPARLLRHRGGPVGRGRYFQVVGRRSSARATPRCTRKLTRKPPRPARPERAPRARLEQRQPHHPGRSLLTGLLLGQTLLHHPRGNLPRAHRGHRLRRARHHRAHHGIRRAGHARVCCGGIAEKNKLLMQIYADVTGCTMQVARIQPGLRARLGRLRGRARVRRGDARSRWRANNRRAFPGPS
jgi:hypothetical protein